MKSPERLSACFSDQVSCADGLKSLEIRVLRPRLNDLVNLAISFSLRSLGISIPGLRRASCTQPHRRRPPHVAERPRRSPWEAAAVPRVPPDEARPTAERQSPPAGVLTPAAAHRRIKHARARWRSPFPRRERLRRARAI